MQNIILLSDHDDDDDYDEEDDMFVFWVKMICFCFVFYNSSTLYASPRCAFPTTLHPT